MSAEKHRFSLIITCYNGEAFIVDCLESLIGQNYSVALFEILFVDDGSCDRSFAMASSYQLRYPNIRLFQIENSGIEKACNYAIRRASFDYVVRVDADDMLDSKFLSVMNDAITENRNTDFFYCQKYYEDHSKSEKHLKWLPPFEREEIFERGDFFATGTVYRKDILAEVGYYSEAVKNCGLENYDLILRLLSIGKIGLAVEGASFFYRRHPTNMSTIKRAAIIEHGRKLLALYQRNYRTNQYHPYGLELVSD